MIPFSSISSSMSLVCILLTVYALGRNRIDAFLNYPAFRSRHHNVRVLDSFQRTSNSMLLATPSLESDQEESIDLSDDYGSNEDTEEQSTASLPDLFPDFAECIDDLGFFKPTPIQAASAKRALDGENLLLIAPTGSGKTLAYLLPALTKAMHEDGTILVVAPTRELAAQLRRDALAILRPLNNAEAAVDQNDNGDDDRSVVLAVRGADIPTAKDLMEAIVLVGTPAELLFVMTNIKGAQQFITGDTLSAVILDEVDVLLPLAPKQLRTALDRGSSGKKTQKKQPNTPQDERRRQEQRRKLMAAKRQGADFGKDNKRVITNTERLLRIVASAHFVGSNDNSAHGTQVLAGSATASRRTLDRLKSVMRDAAVEGASSTYETVWSMDIQPCRPKEGRDGIGQNDSSDTPELPSSSSSSHHDTKLQRSHTIRAVTVPEEVKHRYVRMEKEAAASPAHILEAIAKLTHSIKPETSLVFICGDFGKPNTAASQINGPKPVTRGSTSEARRNALRKYNKKAAQMDKNPKQSKQKLTDGVSARKVCSTLQAHGINALPLHVALGLEQNAEDIDSDQPSSNDDGSKCFVTFEGSARGLHFDGVDVVFVLGRPASAASYLHLAGRVGRSTANEDGAVIIRPGTVISFCTKGSATELTKWTQQIGGTQLEELIL